MIRIRSRTRHVFGVCVAVVLLSAMLPVAPAAADVLAVIYVDPVNGHDSTGGGSAADPFKTITHAMTYSAAGTTIYLEPGTYAAVNENYPVTLKPGVEIVGIEGASETILDAAGSSQVLYILNPTEGTGLSGVTVTNGLTAGWAAGIGIYQDANAPAVQGEPAIIDCIVEGNTAGEGGGGIMMEAIDAAHAISPFIAGCEIVANAAGSDSPGGGILVLQHATPDIWDCTIDGNGAGYGGGVYAGRAYIARCGISNNDATQGGGIMIGGESELSDSSIIGNTAVENGGGLCLNDALGVFFVQRTLIAQNSSGGYGGGVEVRGAQAAVLENAVIAGNSAAYNGGALYAQPGVVEVALDGCTIADNISPSFFDGIYLDSGVHMTVSNSVITHNASGTDDSQDVLLAGTASHTISYSLVQDSDVTGSNLIHGSPEFIDRAAGDYELEAGSWCIDSGDPASTLYDDFYGRPRPEDAYGDGSARVDMGAFERPMMAVDRIAGDNRYETAGVMAQWREWPGTTAVLASGMGFADALSGSGLAGAYEGPLLLTAKDSVPGIVFDALQDAGISDVVIVGGTGVVSNAVKTQLEAEGYGVTRVAGANRYETAAAVAEEIATIMGPAFAEVAFLARGDDFADALAASPIAYAQALPVLLTATGSLPDATRGAITDLGIAEVIVVGGTSAVSQPVEDAVEAMPSVDAGRIAGGNRYATAVMVAEFGVDAELVTWNQVGIATGTNYPDALAGGALCGVRGGVLLLTQPTALPAVTRDTLVANKADVVYAEVYGGTSAVTESVRQAVESALGW